MTSRIPNYTTLTKELTKPITLLRDPLEALDPWEPGRKLTHLVLHVRPLSAQPVKVRRAIYADRRFKGLARLRGATLHSQMEWPRRRNSWDLAPMGYVHSDYGVALSGSEA